MNWLYWYVPDSYVKRYIIMMILIMFVIPNALFGVYYTMIGFLVNLIWYDLIFYMWMKAKEKLGENEGDI